MADKMLGADGNSREKDRRGSCFHNEYSICESQTLNHSVYVVIREQGALGVEYKKRKFPGGSKSSAENGRMSRS